METKKLTAFKAVIKNTGSSEIHNLKVQYRVPKFIDEWTKDYGVFKNFIVSAILKLTGLIFHKY